MLRKFRYGGGRLLKYVVRFLSRQERRVRFNNLISPLKAGELYV